MPPPKSLPPIQRLGPSDPNLLKFYMILYKVDGPPRPIYEVNRHLLVVPLLLRAAPGQRRFPQPPQIVGMAQTSLLIIQDMVYPIPMIYGALREPWEGQRPWVALPAVYGAYLKNAL